MDFVSLAGFFVTICQLALQIRGEEGEFNFFLRFHGSSLPGHMKYAMKFSLRGSISACLTQCEKENFDALSTISKKSIAMFPSFRTKYNL